MSRRNLLLLSNSTIHGTGYLEWASKSIQDFLAKKSVSCILFVPYALTNMDNYADVATKTFAHWGISVESIHKCADPAAAVKSAQAVFIGGGNTFRLLNKLYENKLLEPLRNRIFQDGMPYIGSSAGTNVSTLSVCTTNDMPIVYPPSFEALKLVPFNINPHYIDPSPDDTHMGETRDKRIQQYQEEADSHSVLALREGCLLEVHDSTATLAGVKGAKFFPKNKDPYELPAGDASFLLQESSS